MRSSSNPREAPHTLGRSPERSGGALLGGSTAAPPPQGWYLPAGLSFLPRPLPLSGDPAGPGRDPRPQPLPGIGIGRGMRERQVAKRRRGVGG